MDGTIIRTSVLFLSVVWGLALQVPHRYHQFSFEKTWDEAQKYCRTNYTDLATITDMADMTKLTNNIKKWNTSLNEAWIGLRSESVRKWKWTQVDNQTQNYTNWCNGEPKDKKEYCILMDIKNTQNKGCWDPEDCTEKQAFMCYEKEPGRDKYVFIKTEMTWCDALRYCRTNHTDLVRVRNQSENQEIQNMPASHSHVWIGLTDNSWNWSDQSDFEFQNWNCELGIKLTGTQQCITLNLNNVSVWNDDNCNNKNPFICYKNKFVLINETLTWREALVHCREHYVDLVTVPSKEVQTWVADVARGASTEYVWLGLRHACVLGFWYWVNGEAVCYDNRALGNGTGQEDCMHGDRTGAMQSGGEHRWVSLPETQTLNFICSTYED